MNTLFNFLFDLFNTGTSDSAPASSSTPVPESSPDETHDTLRIPKGKFNPPLSSSDELIILRLSPKDAKEMEKLRQYFESPYEGLISRGLWLLDLFRKADLDSKKLCIVEVEPESGDIMAISPIVFN